MEKRVYKMVIKKASGNASKNAKGYFVSVPSKWAQALGVTEDDRLVELSFDGSKILIEKAEPDSASENSDIQSNNVPD